MLFRSLGIIEIDALYDGKLVSLNLLGLDIKVGLAEDKVLLFYQQNGLTIADFVLFQGIFQLTGILFEIPCGYIADVISKKKVPDAISNMKSM